MAEKFVRSTRGVTDINKLSTNLIEETDIVSTEDGKVFIKGKYGYIEIVASDNKTEQDVAQIKKDITSIKSEQTKIKNRLDKLENPEV